MVKNSHNNAKAPNHKPSYVRTRSKIQSSSYHRAAYGSCIPEVTAASNRESNLISKDAQSSQNDINRLSERPASKYEDDSTAEDDEEEAFEDRQILDKFQDLPSDDSFFARWLGPSELTGATPEVLSSHQDPIDDHIQSSQISPDLPLELRQDNECLGEFHEVLNNNSLFETMFTPFNSSYAEHPACFYHKQDQMLSSTYDPEGRVTPLASAEKSQVQNREQAIGLLQDSKSCSLLQLDEYGDWQLKGIFNPEVLGILPRTQKTYERPPVD